MDTNVSAEHAASIFREEEDGGNRFHRIACTYLPNYMVSHFRRPKSSHSPW
jgi:hypothetical protein